jgi:hypothetical protein
MSLAEQYVSINEYHLAIATYSDILHDKPYNGCALLGRADAYKKIGELDNATRDETIGNMLKPTCNTGGINFQKPAQPSQPNAVALLAGALLH